ncbi:MAG TPA: sugar phosphate isomerase/epimerase family protein [Acidobacteriaceae bacterium]|jgi:sugar phosphate isomerase/epimerase|nr:sugar phosphate isomerase/epimerase family protein [Acidobacteriaceae bacterium]
MSLIERLSFNQMTADPWSLEQVVRNCSRSGIAAIGVWRHKLNGDASRASALIRGEGLRVSSLCRGGWFSAPTAAERRERIADNRLAIEQAAILGAPVLCIVSGPPHGQTLDDARATVLDGLREVLPDAEKAGIKLGIEPLHPMYVAERSVVVTLKQANHMVEQLSSPAVGIVVDAFHVWWDPDLMHQIERARGRIVALHVSDWPVPLTSIPAGRVMMGDGIIELRRLRQAVDATGYDGPIEVEIFNEEIWKSADQGLLELIQSRFIQHV